MRRICLVTYSSYWNDPRVRKQVEALAARGDRVDVICSGGRGEGRFIMDGITLYPFRMVKHRGEGRVGFLLSYAKFFVLAFLRLSYLHLVRKYRVVQVRSIPDFMVFTALLPKILGARVILDIHDPMPEGYMVKFGIPEGHPVIRVLRFQLLLAARFADEVICVSEPHRELFVKHGIPASKLTIVQNLPDERLFRPRPGRVRSREGDGFELVYHGTLADRLGIDVAIRAVDIVRREVSSVIFRVYGGGESLPHLRALVQELHLDGHVHLSGEFHPLEEIPSLIEKAHLGLVPNRRNAVTELMVPTKLLEYFAMGIPVVAPRLGAIEHYFDDRVAFFEPDDPEDLARAILELYYKPEEAEQLARNAFTFLEKTSWTSEREAYYRLIDQLVDGRPGQRDTR